MVLTSRMLKRTLRIGSSAIGPSRVAHWKPETTESLISLRYWTAFVWSTSKLALSKRLLAYILIRISQKAIPSSVGPETPNLPGIGNIPTVLIRKNSGTSLEIITGTNFAGLDVLRYFIGERGSGDIETVVLVG